MFKQLIKQSVTILIILLMVTVPVASAFSHCAGMHMHGDLTASQSLTVTLPVDKVLHSYHKDKEQIKNKVDKQCQVREDCTFHLYGGFSIALSSSTFNVIIAPKNYSTFLHLPLYSTSLSTAIKPPIMIL